MNDNKVFALFYGSPQGFFGANAEIKGLFSTRDLAEKRLLDVVLEGTAIISARIDELTVETPHDPKEPTQYPDVVAALIEGKKIQAIKAMREKVAGLMLKEAKDLVESVDLATIPQEALHAGQKVIEDRRAEAEALRTALPTRFEHQHEAWAYDVLIDGDGDRWVHVGEGRYVCQGGEDEPLPFEDGFADVKTESEVEDRYTINDRFDY